jgi:uncharacterized membrane protein (UPF0127 family)
MIRVLAATVALVLAACSPGASDAATSTAAAAVHPESGLKVIPLTVTTMAGKAHKFRVEVASTGEEQAKALMFRRQMGPDEGMIFPMIPPRGASFWMRNTVISLDLIFIAPDGTISNIAADAIPYNEIPLLSEGPVKAVLEINGGRAKALGIAAGDKVSW